MQSIFSGQGCKVALVKTEGQYVIQYNSIVSTVAEPHARDCGNISTDNVVGVDDVVDDIKERCNFLNCQLHLPDISRWF